LLGGCEGENIEGAASGGDVDVEAIVRAGWSRVSVLSTSSKRLKLQWYCPCTNEYTSKVEDDVVGSRCMYTRPTIKGCCRVVAVQNYLFDESGMDVPVFFLLHLPQNMWNKTGWA
jgi:hypothetical protein